MGTGTHIYWPCSDDSGHLLYASCRIPVYLEKDYTLVADLSADFEPIYLHPAHHADKSSMIGVINWSRLR
jgi:hypothetical protein